MTEKNPQGLCEVNGVLLSNMSRYLFACHPETMSKRDRNQVQKHLKDCPECRKMVDEQR